MKTPRSKITTSIEHEELFIPVTLYIERRRMMRVAFGKDRILIRLPETLTETQQYKEYIKAKEWVIKTLTKKPELKTPFVVKSYTGLKLDVMGHSYHIYVTEENRKTAAGKIFGNSIKIKVPENVDPFNKSKLLQRIIAKVSANQYIGVIKEEVGLLNKKHFDFELNNVSLKYNKSNWGSCSSKKNINLSSRLLLVPKKVREYIIIHELAHLKEMNHSKRFWDLVQSACADFKIYEKWLNEYGPTIDY